MFPELRFGWHANDGALKSLQGVFQQYRRKTEVISIWNDFRSLPKSGLRLADNQRVYEFTA